MSQLPVDPDAPTQPLSPFNLLSPITSLEETVNIFEQLFREVSPFTRAPLTKEECEQSLSEAQRHDLELISKHCGAWMMEKPPFPLFYTYQQMMTVIQYVDFKYIGYHWMRCLLLDLNEAYQKHALSSYDTLWQHLQSLHTVRVLQQQIRRFQRKQTYMFAQTTSPMPPPPLPPTMKHSKSIVSMTQDIDSLLNNM